MAKPKYVVRDGRLFMRVSRHPLAQGAGVQLLSPDEVAQIPGAEYYAQATEVLPTEQGVPVHLPQSAIEPVDRSLVHPERRTAYPQMSEKTAKYRREMTAAEYLRKKTFERPGFYAIQNPIREVSPWPQSVLVAGPSGTAVTGTFQITSEADFEAVKIMVLGRTLVDATWVATRNFLITFKDLASGRDLSNIPIHAESFGGSANEPLILPVTLFINRNASVQVIFTNIEPVSTDMYIYFSLLGIKYYYPSALNLTSGIPEAPEYKRI